MTDTLINEPTNMYNLSKSTDKTLPIYRYKFSETVVSILTEFGKTHQYDPKKIYKEAWETFIVDNEEVLQREARRLYELGYIGDCYDKMYKSARYYFRKKSLTKTDPKQRRKYISCDRDVLDAMDEHISSNIKEKGNNFKPSDGYDDFVMNNQNMILEEITRMIESGFTDKTAIVKKIKKTYKNRYFQIIRSN
tara:strand:- start:28 stop:606 length:579 start_codon:yes stop_codon:yes gene_type:complete